MIRNPNKASVTNEEFLDRVKPIMESWGLKKHPNPTSYFGRSDHGFRYDFADLKNEFDIKIAAFAILNPGPSLWIKGFHERNKHSSNSDIPIIFDNINNVFTLTRRWSILRPLNIRFEFSKKRNQTNKDAALQLIDAVLEELPKLKVFLYG